VTRAVPRITRRIPSYDSTSLAVHTQGEGPPLLCISGGPGRASVYLEDLARLAGTRTLVTPDNRGTGQSEVPADPSTLRADRLVGDVEAVRADLGVERIAVLGHSAGAIVAQLWAAAHPERVEALVLVTPSGGLQGVRGPDIEAIRATRSGEDWYAEAAEAAEALAEGGGGSFRSGLQRALRPFYYGRWSEREQEHAASADRQMSPRAETGFGAGLADADLGALLGRLGSVTAPVLVIAGERDGVTGVEAAQAVADSFPSSRLYVLPGAGHFPWVDAPGTFRTAVEGFLATGR
jgi:proline iminopeptidase